MNDKKLDTRSGECRKALSAAVKLAGTGRPTAEKLTTLGEGWVAEETLAIGVFAALAADSFREGVLLAVNHGGGPRDVVREDRRMVEEVSGMRKKRRKACPKCGSLEVVPIMYGYPMPEAMEAADRGEIELGGCCVGERDPQKYCKACGERFDPLSQQPSRRPRPRT